jgi:TfoX/Sxy family transcriptional regulator of competence genes
MPNDLIPELENILIKATEGLSKVTNKKMFGCYALWANENVFALVWKHGRIGLKLPKEESYKALMKLTRAEPWMAGPMKMANWVLVPPTFHTKINDLKKWATVSHSHCLVLEKKPKKTSGSVKKKIIKKVPKKK